MKKTVFLFLSAAFLFACNQSSDKKKVDEHADHSHAETTALTLNNGAKWKADSITNNNVVGLKTIADNFRIKPFPTANDYQVFGADLSNGLNKMIQECKMSGPDHEALHHWLEPVLSETNQLKNVTDTAVAAKTFKSIDKRIDDYYNYFE
jgi:hypothetical protein